MGQFLRLYLTLKRNKLKTGKDKKYHTELVIIDSFQKKIFQIVSLVLWKYLHLGTGCGWMNFQYAFPPSPIPWEKGRCDRGSR